MQKSKILIPLIIIYIISLIILYSNRFLTPQTHEITGAIDGCCCEAEILRATNLEIDPILDELSHTLFFKLFRVNLDTDCPFWAQQLLCIEKSKCLVRRSNDNEIPTPWKAPKTDLISLNSTDISSVVDEKSVPSAEEWFFEEEDQGVYVNLKENQEAWTGYQGQKIWSVIYGENCFNQEMCKEEKMFNNLISGLHTSISSHLTEYYFEEGRNKSKPNFRLFFEKVGNFPERIKNLYFIYSVLLRAINVAGNYVKDYEINTGNFQNDIKTKELLAKIIEKIGKYCDFPIKEQEFFSDVSKIEIRKQFQSYFYNISKIMDCVECEKCKVYGKMQIAGIGTALRILFSEKEQNVLSQIRRNEFIALMNTFAKIAKSLVILDQMFERRYNSKDAIFMTILACGMVMIIFLYIVMRAWEDMDGKLKRKFRMAGNIEKKHLKQN